MVDILFLAHKRPEFTRASLRALLASLDYKRLTVTGTRIRLSIFTDGDQPPANIEGPFCDINRYGGPVACMNAYLDSCNKIDAKLRSSPEATPDFIAKVDNDTIVPPGWLPACVDIMRRYPNIDLLGIEPWTPDRKLFPRWSEPLMPVPDNHWKFQPRVVSHVGGIGLFRRSAFERFGRPVPNSQDGRYGFTEWMWQHPRMVKAFIDPPLPVFLLDHLFLEPWQHLSQRYEREGIQRNVEWLYGVELRVLWDWWLASGEAVTRGEREVPGEKG
jgi:hypothetical protein